jgi:hypothetical protein
MYVGPGRLINGVLEPIDCKPGDYVLFPEQAGMDFTYNDVDLKVIRWGDIQAILDRDVKTAEDILKAKDSDLQIEVFDTVMEGTVKEKLIISLNGQRFALQGNALEPLN